MRFSRLNQVACKLPGPATKTFERKLLKNFLSVFCDWKFHSWKSCELSCENLYVSFATRPSTREQVTNLSREKHEIQTFEKYSKSFSQLKHLPANESSVSREKSLWWTRDWGLVLPATKSPEQGNTVFEFLTIFVKTKYFPKTTKHSKIFLWLINKDRACENTFNQVQSHEWIWHSLNIGMCVAYKYKKWDSP